jgi:formate-dependent nitrite reductase cytochrome c552 subunit
METSLAKKIQYIDNTYKNETIEEYYDNLGFINYCQKRSDYRMYNILKAQAGKNKFLYSK